MNPTIASADKNDVQNSIIVKFATSATETCCLLGAILMIKKISIASTPFPIQWCEKTAASQSLSGVYNSPPIIIKTINTIETLAPKRIPAVMFSFFCKSGCI